MDKYYDYYSQFKKNRLERFYNWCLSNIGKETIETISSPFPVPKSIIFNLKENIIEINYLNNYYKITDLSNHYLQFSNEINNQYYEVPARMTDMIYQYFDYKQGQI